MHFFNILHVYYAGRETVASTKLWLQTYMCVQKSEWRIHDIAAEFDIQHEEETPEYWLEDINYSLATLVFIRNCSGSIRFFSMGHKVADTRSIMKTFIAVPKLFVAIFSHSFIFCTVLLKFLQYSFTTL